MERPAHAKRDCMKRRRDSEMMAESQTGTEHTSPFIAVFERFRSELDQHYDTRERIIKASRDVTAASKKIIFALQRSVFAVPKKVSTLGPKLPTAIERAVTPHYETIKDRLKSITEDLQVLGFYRYASNITGGIQEMQEALLFQSYLQTQQLMTYDAAMERLEMLSRNEQGHTIKLSPNDYVLGIYDMTGELMRFLVTSMATNGALPSLKQGGASGRSALDDLRAMRHLLETLEAKSGTHGSSRDAKSKLHVTQTSVDKVEKALYGLVVRGSERPKGWLPDYSDERQPALGNDQ